MSNFVPYPRPRMCPEPRCTPVFQWPAPGSLEWDAGQRDDPPGESWFCFGAMPEVVAFEYDGVQHPNDLRSCTYTPLKGLVAFQENREDWWGMFRAYDKALERLDQYREGQEGEDTR